MNLLLLVAALLPWAASPVAVFTRIFLAVSLLSIEMQLVTLSGIGTLYTLPIVNGVLAVLLVGWQRSAGAPFARPGWRLALRPAAPWPAIALLGAIVVLLNAWLPLEAADPYHLDRVAQIERLGTLAHDPAADPKVNLVGWVYELILADVRQIPAVGPALVKMHGLFGLLLYSLTVATVYTLLRPPSSRWPVVALIVVAPVFHQLVLIKNDLFVAMPTLVALAWLITRADSASWKEAAWAGWLIGLVAGYKLTNLPLAIIMAGGIIAAGRGRAWRPLGGLALGGLVGAVASGLPLTLWENARVYGDAFASGPVADIGERTSGVAMAAENVARFGISLLDLGLLTPVAWPGRGGWGGTFGLPFIWAMAVLILHCRQAREARWALSIAALHFLLFAAMFTDADLAHRLVLAPALLVIAAAIHLTDGGERSSRWARVALVPILVLSSAQILRSAVLYLGPG